MSTRPQFLPVAAVVCAVLGCTGTIETSISGGKLGDSTGPLAGI